VTPLSAEVLDSRKRVLHYLRGESKDHLIMHADMCCENVYMPVNMKPPSYPAMNLRIDGVKVAVGSADVDELNQRSDTDSL
jgi:hypothetical protein